MAQTRDYFSPDYFTAQTRFREAVRRAGGRLETLDLDAKGPGGEILSIDVGWFGTEKPRRVLVHSSGVHGVEAFAGSAVQLQLLDQLPKLPEDTALVLVHVVNPYGMSWLRRFNENNVDLNRNFMEEGQFRGAPAEFAKVLPLLCPESAPGPEHFYSLPVFYFQAAWQIVKYGYSALKQAVAGGQYEYPKCLFFGGKRLEQGPQKYQAFLAQALSSAERIIAIDVHTALGKSGEDTLLVEKNCEELREIFGPRVECVKGSKRAYVTSGSMENGLSRALPRAQEYFLTQEFGTYGPLRVLYALREENRWHRYGKGTLDHPAKRRIKEAFGPDDERWRKKVLSRGQALVTQAMGVLFKESK